MQLKEFSLISPVIESADLFRAIETAIPLEVIEQTIGHIEAQECDDLGRIPKHVKFPVELVLDDGSYLSWDGPRRQVQEKRL